MDQLMMKYLEEAASLSDPAALFALGDIYFNGLEGKEVDYQKALQYFKLAGKNGQ